MRFAARQRQRPERERECGQPPKTCRVAKSFSFSGPLDNQRLLPTLCSAARAGRRRVSFAGGENAAADERATCGASSQEDAKQVAQSDADGDSQDKNVGVVDRKSSSGFVGESRKRFAHENVRRLLNEDSEALGTEGVQTSSTSRRTSRRLERSACTLLIFQEPPKMSASCETDNRVARDLTISWCFSVGAGHVACSRVDRARAPRTRATELWKNRPGAAKR